MTALEELEAIGTCLDRMTEGLPLVKALGADPTRLQTLLDALYRESAALRAALEQGRCNPAKQQDGQAR